VFDTDFLGPSPASRQAYRAAIDQAATVLAESLPQTPYSGKSPGELAALLGGELCSAEGTSLEAALRQARSIIEHSVVVGHPFTAAHLHCPPLHSALAAEVILTALNQSMDSFDQAPAATVVEQHVLRFLCQEAGLPAGADGTMTPGGTLSNYMGLLLARDAWCHSHLGWPVREKGLPPAARRFRILCSELSHFSVEKSAVQLGLGTAAVVRIAVDANYRLCPHDLQRQLDRLAGEGQTPLAIVATAGTTDFGSIDPLEEIADCTRRAGAWMHVDAAYGGALLFSQRHRHKLAGLERADSISLDFHKLFWQPISCGAFLLRDVGHFEHIRLHADYLNPEDHEESGIPDLVTRSVLTSRRFDALKVWLSFRVLGRRKLGTLIDRTLDLAAEAAAAIRENPRLELLHEPALGCVLFRYRPQDDRVDSNAVNDALRRRLFDTGRLVLGHTRVAGRRCLKLTLLNPCVEANQIRDLLALVAKEGQSLELK
jgi:L-2,4-diaminobutyrate decarboxylase